MGLHREETSIDGADVLVVGVPYDGSVSHDPGAAEAPDVLRKLSTDAPSWTEDGLSFADLRVRDVGDVAVDQEDDEATQAAVRSAVQSLPSETSVILALGGDHSITSGVLSGLQHKDRLGVLWFDAHPDLMDKFQGINGKRESQWNHACPLRRILELDGVSDTDVFLVGTRDFLPEEFAYIREHELNVVWARELPTLPARDLADRIEEAFVNVDSLYASFDIDVLDPSAAPGTGVPIPGGMTTRHLYDTLQELTRRATDPVHSCLPRLLGFDLVEVSPPADVNHITALAGMGILINTLGLIAVQRGLSRDVPQ
jgi:agmatinase